MILKGSQRGNASQLASHLLNASDNEHISVHEVRGFLSDELHDALSEADAIAKGTRCKQFLFSLNLSPPETENVSVEAFEAAIEMAEQKLGLDGHSRAIVFHEKEGRRHAHAVWSRIDAQTMTAKNLPFFKTRLSEVSKELYLENGWDLPKGFIDRNFRNPLNFSLKEWQQAKRVQQDPRVIKAMFKDCWQRSDSGEALKKALNEKGYFLAKGDRRAIVAVDFRGEVYALSRWSGVKACEVKARFSNEVKLDSVAEVKTEIAARMDKKLTDFIRDIDLDYRKSRPAIEYQRAQMVGRQKKERAILSEKLEKRQRQEEAKRTARVPKGLGGVWSRITGKMRRIRHQNEYEAWQAHRRDTAEKDKLIWQHLEERQRLQQKIKAQREERSLQISELQQEIASYLTKRRTTLPPVKGRNIADQKPEKSKPLLEKQAGKQKSNSGPSLDM